MKIEELLENLEKSVSALSPSLQTAAYLTLARALPEWKARAATYFAYFRVADIERAFAGAAFVDAHGPAVESALVSRSIAPIQSACASWRARLLRQGMDDDLRDEILGLLDGLTEPAASVGSMKMVSSSRESAMNPPLLDSWNPR
jgi:hypothetical protein